MNIHPTYRYPNGLQEGPPPEGGHGRRLLQQGWRWLWRGALGVCALLLVVFLAWVVSNWRDAPARPRPPELALPTAQVPAPRNAYFTLLGLQAAADRDAAQVGQALWQDQMQLARALQVAADPAAQQAAVLARVDAEKQRTGGPLPTQPPAAPLNCDDLTTDCVALGLAKADLLAQQRQLVAVQGARCDATVDLVQPGQGGAIEEALPTHWHVAALPMQHLGAALFCSRWQHSGAVLMFRQGRKEEAWRLLTRSNHWHRALHAGMHTLVSQQVVHGVLRRHLVVVSKLAALDPAWLAQALPLLAQWDAPEPGVRRWMVAESALQRATFQALGQNGLKAQGDVPAPHADGGGWALEARAALMQPLEALQRHHIGWHPERTAQWQDQQWLWRIRQLDAGLAAAALATRHAELQPHQPPWGWWINPFGRMLVEVSQGAYDHYLHRPLDLELHREAAALALNALRLQIAPGARAAWAQLQALSPALKERLAWSSDGRTLNVRSWASDQRPAGQDGQLRDRIQVTLDR